MGVHQIDLYSDSLSVDFFEEAQKVSDALTKFKCGKEGSLVLEDQPQLVERG